MTKAPFVHLHTHSHFSLLDGLTRIEEMVDHAKRDGAPAIALTDHGNLYGAIEFYKKCQEEGIRPIIGVEGYVTPGSRHDKRPGIDTTRYHITLLAKNNTGYRNLITLVTRAHTEGYYYKPRMDKELLRECAEGIICLSGCFGGELAHAIRSGEEGKPEEVAREYEEIFGKGNYYLEIMHHPGVEGLEEVKQRTIALSRELDIPLVATQDSHYPAPDDQRAHETLLAIQTNADLGDENRFSMRQEDFSLIDTETAYQYFSDVPEAVENTAHIAEQCTIELDLGNWTFPDIHIPEGTTADAELSRLAYEGIEQRDMSRTDEVVERLEYELDVIRTKGFSVYFLIVADLLRYAREQRILTTIRGSVAGSLVTYLVGITNVDPLTYKLPFNRFLNPERPSAPDIDMDFADNRRDEVIEYAREKYGSDKVAQIGTFGTMLARGAVRDVARALGYEYAVGDRISRLIPQGSQGFPITIDRALEEEPELAEMYKNDTPTKEIIDLARRIEGCARHISVHAAGVVISPTALTDYVPVQHDPKGGKLITQYDMHGVEDAGLIKFDFLGLRNLSILGDAVKLVQDIHGTEIDIEDIPLDDQKTFAMLSRGETMGVFQLNGTAMTAYLRELEPSSINDINAMIALYRPGPMKNIPEYIERKKGRKPVRYMHPKMERFLKESYGILVYQEDIMFTALELAGYTWETVDKLRKAIGKKIPEEMAKQHEIFVQGCIDESGMTKEQAEEIWNLFEPFQGYGFNKAHAASYGRVAYQTAYMKAHYPAEFMTAVLTADSGDTEKVAEIIAECERMELPVLPPDVNESFGGFTVKKAEKKNETDKIRFGLYTIKNVGTDISDAIIEERKTNGAFSSYSDFLERITHRNLNKKSLEALIQSGAMDAFGERGHMLANLDEALAYNREQSSGMANQGSLFEGLSESANAPRLVLKDAEEATKTQKLAWEKELLGLYVSGHPLDEHKDKLKERDISVPKSKRMREGMVTVTAGIVSELRTIYTKNNSRMAFVKIADHNDTIEAVAFPRIYSEYRHLLEESDQCIKVKGRISERNGDKSIVLEAIKPL